MSLTSLICPAFGMSLCWGHMRCHWTSAWYHWCLHMLAWKDPTVNAESFLFHVLGPPASLHFSSRPAQLEDLWSVLPNIPSTYPHISEVHPDVFQVELSLFVDYMYADLSYCQCPYDTEYGSISCTYRTCNLQLPVLSALRNCHKMSTMLRNCIQSVAVRIITASFFSSTVLWILFSWTYFFHWQQRGHSFVIHLTYILKSVVTLFCGISCLKIYWVRQELKIQMVLWHKSGLFHVQWQCRFRTLVSMLNNFFICFIFMFYLYLIINKLLRKWVEFQLVIP